MSTSEMDIVELEKKIADIEEILGIDDLTTTKPIPVQIEAVRAKLRDDCKATLLLSIPVQKLEQLSKIATETAGPFGSLADKVDSIKFSENLIQERADRIKNFSEALEPCLDQELFSKVAELQPELDAEIQKYEKALEEWTQTYGTFQTLVAERAMINRRITERVLDLQSKINKLSSSSQA
ncbi:hypothetical protein CAEBREN_16094 [Caenorhabditis brenneri]|uniref:Uncharacterized protein n=1 Tax=Caenorhabditis brenneri TaxID=135651 RepID=G0NQN4_CAEBE|nr:hypothetical protein CAEBREN_16094 [Caenorhabditis brenneri]